MKGFLFSILITLSAQASWAIVDVTCFKDDCFQNGWMSYDTATGQEVRVQCLGQGCNVDGWWETIHGRVIAEVQCNRRSCFEYGWRTRDEFKRVTADAFCMDGRIGSQPNCLTFGWEIRSNEGYTRNVCKKSDCSNEGWSITSPRGIFEVDCKDGGCFTSGWVIQ